MLLSIESSCDESALALFNPAKGILWEAIHSQIPTHAKHGGVVPELAVREHLRKLPELLARMQEETGVTFGSEAAEDSISRLAVTVGPGLVGSLAMGMALARALELQYNLPLVGVNHLRAHAFSVFIESHRESPTDFASNFQNLLPHLGLLVSGGNTLLYEIGLSHGAPSVTLLARTVDDAAGEALDKAAKMLGLPYPGGPLIEKIACEGDPAAYQFPIPFRESHGLGFSFSGLKTSLRYKLLAMSAAEVEKEKSNLAASFQSAVVGALALMVRRALKQKNYRSLGVGGGVAQNALLRESLAGLGKDFGIPLLAAKPWHCGDNAGMVAFAAWADAAGVRVVDGFEPALGIAD